MSFENPMDKLMQMKNTQKQTPARKRINALFDQDSFVELDAFCAVDSDACSVITGYGYIDGSLVYAFSQDATKDNGAIGTKSASKIVKLYQLAVKTGAPIVAIYDSNGMKVSEGHNALYAYGEILASANNVSGVVPQISVIAGVCGGTSAMIAAGADVVIMAKDAEFFLNAPFTVEANGEKNVGAGTSENAEKAGCVHIVCEKDIDCVTKAREIISMLPLNNLSVAPICEFEQNPKAYELSADTDCPTCVVKAVCDNESFIELSENFGQGARVFLATVSGNTTGFVATRKKHEIDGDTCSKIARFVRFCDAFSIPLVTVVDSVGFAKTAKGELDGSVRGASKLAHAYAEATCPKISLVTGNAVGAAYIALAGKGANADLCIAWPNAVISALEPKTAVEFMWSAKLKGATDMKAKRAELEDEYKATLASAFEGAKYGIVDDIIEPTATRDALISALDMLSGKRVNKLPKKHSNMPM